VFAKVNKMILSFLGGRGLEVLFVTWTKNMDEGSLKDTSGQKKKKSPGYSKLEIGAIFFMPQEL